MELIARGRPGADTLHRLLLRRPLFQIPFDSALGGVQEPVTSGVAGALDGR
jgi:hypothetical protein